MRRGKSVVVAMLCLGLAAVCHVQAVSTRSWVVASADEFGRGEFEGTALDQEGHVRVAPTAENLWGPEQGIVWDVEPDGAGGAFIAVSSPTRVLRVARGREPEIWYATGDETLVAAALPDSSGGLYFGLSPDGRVMHAAEPGNTREVAVTDALFVWSLAASPDGSIWIGTGFPGRLLRLGSDGETRAIFEAGDDPVRCIVALEDGSVVFGTGGRGRVVRVDREGRAFVLFDADEAEIVDLEADESGVVYALTAVGSKQVAAARSSAERPNATVQVTATAPSGGEETESDEAGEPEPSTERRQQPGQSLSTPPGGRLYRIEKDSDFQQIWQATNEVPFGLVRRDDGTLLVATGDQGRVYAIDEGGRSSIVAQIPSDQASALARDRDGTVLVGGTTDARVTRLGPAPRARGSYLSAVHDAGGVVDWGRLRWQASQPASSEIRAHVRAGNTAEPDETWTDWMPLSGSGAAGIDSGLPPSRWSQTRFELEPSRGGDSPSVRRMELSYLPRNRRPTISDVTVQPAGVVWSVVATQAARSVGPVVADDPVARKTVAELGPNQAPRPVRRSYELGARTISWSADDVDGDRLTYRVDIRREDSSVWIPLAVAREKPFFGWDARGLPDGSYRARVVADDARDNPDGKGQDASGLSGAFQIDNTRPQVGAPKIRRDQGRYEVEFVASDAGGNVAATEIAVDTGDWKPLDPLDGVADSAEELYQLVVDPPSGDEPTQPRTVKVRVTDSAGNMGGDAWALDDEP